MGFLSRLLFRGLAQPNAAATDIPVPTPTAPLRPREFGPFSVFWQARPPNYLPFLGLGSPAVQPALRTLSTVLRTTDGPRRYVELMLQANDWRPHLVAAVAALLSDDPTSYVPALWRTFDAGSWVSPQLVVALYLSDPTFKDEAKQRIVAHFSVALNQSSSSVIGRSYRCRVTGCVRARAWRGCHD
jgi:hypothetical protein